jgi:hypothetical protein
MADDEPLQFGMYSEDGVNAVRHMIERAVALVEQGQSQEHIEEFLWSKIRLIQRQHEEVTDTVVREEVAVAMWSLAKFSWCGYVGTENIADKEIARMSAEHEEEMRAWFREAKQ